MENEKGSEGKMERRSNEDFQRNLMVDKVASGLRTGFYYHLAVYLTVNLLLLVIGLYLTPGFFWVMWTAMGWGIGIIIHGLSALLFSFSVAAKSYTMQK